MLPTSIWTDQPASSVTVYVPLVEEAKPTTALPASTRRFSTPLPKTQSTALPLVGPDSTQMVQIVEVSRI